MKEDKITVFTPTFNREYIIHQCYESLCRQTNQDFIWLIVDDGSTDETELLVKNWIVENKINIKYIKQNNMGKYIAHNSGVLQCETGIFVCVDSDDYLVNNAIQRIYDNWSSVKDDKEIAGLIALKGYSESTPVGPRMPNVIQRCSIFDLYHKYKFKGDTLLAFKTEVLKNFLFPVIEGENFITEAVIYDRISQKFDMVLLDEILYLCNYLPDGYSNNLKEIHRKNPKGYLLYLTQRIEFAKTQKEKILACSYYIAGCWRIKSKPVLNNNINIFIFILSIPKAIVIFMKSTLKKPFKKLGILR